MIPAAAVIPIIFANVKTNGLPVVPISFHGKMVTITKTPHIENQDTPQHLTHRTTQRDLRVLFASPAVIPISSTP